MRCRFLMAFLAAVSPSAIALAAGDGSEAVEVFQRTCLAQGSSFDAIASAAAAEGWKPLSEGDFERLAPLEHLDSSSRWMATDRALPEPVVIGVTKARRDGRPVETCTVAFTKVPIEAFLKAFSDRTSAEKLSEEPEGTWTSRLYVLIAGDRKQFVKLKYARSPDGNGPMAASSIAER
ncbi:hypothetical protein QN219_33395 [Sinorhizobium sp. 7-81]|uniref:hypothetical protein n=1 Tax=Sinorhizobium sp. 8-89 TaxID=3049089 RepID=UPI0024C2CA76|nr:hypothetical protein [Sinorhizobium sp. 8-89]MDK1494799.1 hypothetical protein [Sinorhizobium sp. 8-89]